MPCAFRNPALMVIHCCLAAHRAHLVAKNACGGEGSIPYILAGIELF